MTDLKLARTDRLDIAYLEHGPQDGPTSVLMHGFPYDVHAYDEVARQLAAQGVRSLVPYLRGYGPTRFRHSATPRSGEQAALGADLVALLDTLSIERAVLAGYDWGGRAACVVAALDPSRVTGLVTSNGYNIQSVGDVVHEPASPIDEHRKWYQYYLHGERGRRGLEQNRRDFCQLLWQTWSPSWAFSDHTYARTAASFDNPDFVDVVVHSYRVRYGLADPDPAYADAAERLRELPDITVPTIVLDPSADGVEPLGSTSDPLPKFAGPSQYRLLQNIGHNAPQEAPDAFAAAVHDLIRG